MPPQKSSLITCIAAFLLLSMMISIMKQRNQVADERDELAAQLRYLTETEMGEREAWTWIDENRVERRKILASLGIRTEQLEDLEMGRLVIQPKVDNSVPQQMRRMLKANAEQDKYMYQKYFYGRTEPGVFVEIGARNGRDQSNTYLLERGFNWTGILVEPHKRDFNLIRRFRPNSLAVNAAVCAHQAPSATFIVSNWAGAHGLAATYHSHLLKYANGTIEVPCVTLSDLLLKAGLNHVDYLTISTQGSEHSILSTFDTSRFVVDFIQVAVFLPNERKSDPREPIIETMRLKGYEMVRDWHYNMNYSDLIFKRKHGADIAKFTAVKAAGFNVTRLL